MTDEPSTAPADDERAALAAKLADAERALEAVRAERDQFLDRLKRLQADFENQRKRVRKESDEARERAREAMLKPVLAVMDNVDRALEQSGSEESLYEGVRLVFRDLRALIEREGVKRIDTEGHPFNPNLHEAVMREVTSEYPHGTVIKELERGYLLDGRVLRAAKVKVAVAPPAEAADASPAGGGA